MSLLLTGGGGSSVVAGSSYTATGVRFDGATYFTGTTNTPFTGATPSKKYTVSFWFRMQGNNGNFQQLFENSLNTGLMIARENGNFWGTAGYDASNGSAGNLNTNGTFFTAPDTWHHLFATFDGTSAPSSSGAIFIDGVDKTGGFAQAGSPTNIDFGRASTMTLGARIGGSLFVNADIADFYMNFGTYLDPTTNLTKFRTAGGSPVDLGADGSVPTGTPPIAFFSANGKYAGATVANWSVNKGTGGDKFTSTPTAGALTASTSNP
jgi:hypothetical protein